MRPDSTVISNVAFTMACVTFVVLGTVRVRETFRSTAASAVAKTHPEPVQSVDLRMSLKNVTPRGDPKATLIMVELSDFQCPFCAQFLRDTFASLKKEYIDTGRIQYAFMHFPLENHPLASKASEAAECAGEQEAFWEMHDWLFNHQSELELDALQSHALTLGLNVNEFRDCLGGRTIRRVREQSEYGRQLGVTSTPTFLIGTTSADGNVRVSKKITGALPLDIFRSALDGLLKNDTTQTP
jgi:protein-disulfide isomerase